MTSSPVEERHVQRQLWLVTLLTLAAVLHLGYNFGEVNHNEQLPMVLRALDPDFLRGDWVINANQGLNHRSFYTGIMALASRILGVEGAFFGIYLGSSLAWASGVCALTQTVWKDDKVTPIAAVVAPLLLLFSDWGTISNTLVFNNLVPALPSLALVVWFGVMLRRGKLVFAAFLLLASGLIHAQIGPISGVFLLLAQAYALRDEPADRRRLLLFLPWLLGAVALPLGLALLSSDKRSLTAAQSREVLEILTFLRHPHHYVPGTWGRDAWLSEIAWLLLIGVARYIAAPSRFLDGILVATLVFCISGWLPFVVDCLFPLVKLQHFRMSVWLQIAGSVYLARVIALWWNDEARSRRIAGIIVFAAFVMPWVANASGFYLLLLPLCLAVYHFASRHVELASLLILLPWLPWSVTGRAAFFALAVLWLLALGHRRPHFAMWVYQGGTLLGVAALCGLFFYPPTGRLGRRIRVQTHMSYEKPSGAMEKWVKFNTPQDATFLIPLTLETFRLKSNRAVVVDFKVFPWSDAGLLEWRRRIDAVLGASLPLGDYKPEVMDAIYANLGAAQIEGLARKYGASYVVAPAASNDSFRRFSLVYSDANWRVFRLQLQ